MIGVKQFKMKVMDNFSYLIWDEPSREAAAVDPSFDCTPIYTSVDDMHLRLKYILITHHHFDHVIDAHELKRKTGAKLVSYVSSPFSHDIGLKDGESLNIGGSRITLIHTPGHTADSSCYLVSGNLFTGDTLYVGECGRVDLEDSSPSDMYETLLVKLQALPDSTIVYPGHDYGKSPFSTIGEEKRSNYTMAQRTKEEFLKFITS